MLDGGGKAHERGGPSPRPELCVGIDWGEGRQRSRHLLSFDDCGDCLLRALGDRRSAEGLGTEELASGGGCQCLRLDCDCRLR